MYDSLLVLNSKMMALKKGMKADGIGLEEFVNLHIEVLRKQTSTIDSGVCTFCFNKKGKVQWPDAVQRVMR